MKKNIITIFALLLTIISCAQTETFDIATYKAPKGWEKTTKEGVVSYSTSDETKGSYCIISVYASSATVGNAGEEFMDEWKEFVATPFEIIQDPETEKTEDDGWEIISGGANFTSNEMSNLALLTTFIGYGRTTSVLSLTNDESHQKDIEDFLSNIDIKKTATKTTAANSTAPKTNSAATTTTATITSFKPGNNLEGVWMAIHLKKNYYDKVPSGTVKWITFFNNGRVAKLLPDDGMDKYNKIDPEIGYYSISNGKASLQWFKDVAPFAITFKTKDQIQFQEPYSSDTYFRCKSVDGVRLNGTWTSYNNVNDPELDDNSKNRSMITLKQDGSFIDYGMFADDYSAPVPAGSGTYEISNFTLTLHYTNGTVKQTSFTGSLNLDIKTNNSMIYIHRLAFLKRN